MTATGAVRPFGTAQLQRVPPNNRLQGDAPRACAPLNPNVCAVHGTNPVG